MKRKNKKKDTRYIGDILKWEKKKGGKVVNAPKGYHWMKHRGKYKLMKHY